MGMTIEEAITHIMDVICENNTIKHSDLVVFDNEKQALRIAAETMHKYQKIEQIVEHWACCGNPSDSMIAISEVIDGNVD
jgi:hypothetical protein